MLGDPAGAPVATRATWSRSMKLSLVVSSGRGTPLLASVATQTGQRTDANGFPFLWEAMAREEIRQDPSVLL